MSSALQAITHTALMGPGPSNVPDAVMDALSLPTVGHLDPRFIAVMDEVKAMLRRVFGTDNELTLPLSGTGSAGMEACFANIVEPGDPVLVLQNGVFGMRMADVASRLGAEVTVLEFEWGTAVSPDRVAEALDRGRYRIVAVVHAETSTGVCNPVGTIAPMAREAGALLIVDAVTSLGGMDVPADSWGADAVYSGTQKCLSCPPGLAPATFSRNYVDAMNQRRSPVPNWYLDLSLLASYWEGNKRAYHHTAPVNMVYALHAALGALLNEGLEAAHARHLDAHHYLASELQSLGLDLFVSPEVRLPMLNAVSIPAGVDDGAVRSALLAGHGIEIGAGLGPLAGRIWRVGLMGHTARRENVDKLILALREILA
jgi:alanine-glyoxylate transaminase/serine-glyoxylate transaminase/serine-pyruvate transaminase